MTGLGNKIDGLYKLEVPKVDAHISNVHSILHSKTLNKNALWHCRLGHMSEKGLKILHSRFPYISSFVDDSCHICHLAKQKHLPYSLSDNKASTSFQLLYLDIWGPYSVSTLHGHRYFLTIVDDFSRFTWVHLMIHKSKTQSLIQNFIKMVETQFAKTVKVLITDNGLEFSMSQFYASKGIVHQTS